jgi:peptidoglycan-N-acetylglucosamine deacetylase
MTPSQVYELWAGEFDYMVANCPSGVYNLTCHPDFIGRGSRLVMLERLIEHMKEAGARFERLRDVALRFKEENPLEEWAKANPHRTGATARNAGAAVAGS